MKVTVEKVNLAQQRLHITLPIEAVDQAFDTIYAQMQKKLVVPGFRPGKAPLSLVKKYKTEETAQEATRQLLDKFLYKAIVSVELAPLGRPVLENEGLAQQGHEYIMSVLVEIAPEIELGNAHENMVIDFKEFSLDEKQVDSVIADLAKRKSEYTPIDDAQTGAASGMVAIVDLHPKGHAHLGQHDHQGHDHGQEHHHSHGREIFIDDASDDQEIKQALKGMKVGETKEVSVTSEGNTTQLVLGLSGLFNCKLSPVDDELAKGLGLEGLEQLKEFVRSSLKMRMEYDNNSRLESALLEAYINRLDIVVPPNLLTEVVDATLRQMRFEEQKMTAEQHKETMSRVEAQSTHLIKSQLLLKAACKKFGLTASAEEIDQKEALEKQTVEQENKKAKGTKNKPRSRHDIEHSILFKKFIDFLTSNALINRSQVPTWVPFPFPWYR